jgi:hypothetical protein
MVNQCCLWQAFKRVKGNGGSPGIDGMTVDDFADYLKPSSVCPTSPFSNTPALSQLRMVHRKVDLFPRYCRILFSTNSTASWSDEGIVLYGMRTIATSMSAAGERASA